MSDGLNPSRISQGSPKNPPRIFQESPKNLVGRFGSWNELKLNTDLNYLLEVIELMEDRWSSGHVVHRPAGSWRFISGLADISLVTSSSIHFLFLFIFFFIFHPPPPRIPKESLKNLSIVTHKISLQFDSDRGTEGRSGEQVGGGGGGGGRGRGGNLEDLCYLFISAFV